MDDNPMVTVSFDVPLSRAKFLSRNGYEVAQRGARVMGWGERRELVSKRPRCEHCPGLLLENDRLRKALVILSEWDMLTLDADGHGVATADAPWARDIIRHALDAWED